jgi:preprotein translocase subunit SecD
MRKIWISAAVIVAAIVVFLAWSFVTSRAHVVIQLDRAAAGPGTVRDLMQAHLKDVEERASGFGTMTHALVQIDGDKFVIDIMGYSDAKVLARAFGPQLPLTVRLVDDTGYDPLNDEMVRNLFPAPGEPALALRRPVLMTGRNVSRAAATFDTQTGRPAVEIGLDSEGTQAFAQLTRHYVGHRIAILLGHSVLTAPRVLDPITKGNLLITGNFTAEQSQDLAAAIKLSSGDWPFTLVEARAADR